MPGAVGSQSSPGGSAISSDKHDLSAKIKAACAAYDALSPVDKALADSDQRRSYVLGETGRDPGDVLAEEVRRLRSELAVAQACNNSGAATPSAYRWISEAVKALRAVEYPAGPQGSQLWREIDELLSGVPVPPEDLGFDSPADRYAKAWHALNAQDFTRSHVASGHAVTCKMFPDPYDEREPAGPCTCGLMPSATQLFQICFNCPDPDGCRLVGRCRIKNDSPESRIQEKP